MRRLPKGADTSHLRDPFGSHRAKKRAERREARASRSRSRSSSPSSRVARARTAAGGDTSQGGNRFAALGAVQEQQVLEAGEIEAAEADAEETLAAAAAEPLPVDDDELMPPANPEPPFRHPLIGGPD